MKIHDLIVIGAGPAGSSAAKKGAELGLNVLVIDKESFPRDKPCGGGLSAAAYKELGEDLPEHLIEQKCYGMRSVYRNQIHMIESETPVAYMIRRIHFDNYLLEQALSQGAVFSQETCRAVRETSGLVEIETDKGTHYSRYCIGADGFFSPTAKSVRAPFSKAETRFCLISHPADNGHPIRQSGKPVVELDFGFIRKGYGWLFPKGEFISAGIGGEAASAKELRHVYKTFLASHNLDQAEKPQGCFIPVSNLKHKLATGRIMLAGDAAGLVDSFSGEGIRNALISGRLAAEKATEAKSRDGAVQGYKRSLLKKIGNNLIWSERMTRVSSRFENLVYGRLLADERVMKRYFEILRGDRSYRSFFLMTMLELPLIILSGKYKKNRNA